MTVYILRGPSGAGKSTYRRHPVFSKAFVVSRDLIRPMLGMTGKGVLKRSQERQVTDIETLLIRKALRAGQDVVVDNTNLNNQFARRYADEAHLMGHDFKEIVLYNPDNDEEYVKRSDIPEEAVRKQLAQAKRMKPIKPRIPQPFKPVEQNFSLDPTYIFDIDGTLARMTGRSPYDLSEVSSDELVPEVAYFLKPEDVVVTGRSEEARADTEDWFRRNLGWVPKIYMRKERDTRPDSLVKSEILDELVKERYIVGVFDDRERVVEMWITRGLQVFDVGQGVASW